MSVVFIIEDMGIRPLFDERISIRVLLHLSGNFISTLFIRVDLIQSILIPDHAQLFRASVAVHSCHSIRKSDFFPGLGFDLYVSHICIKYGSVFAVQLFELALACLEYRRL